MSVEVLKLFINPDNSDEVLRKTQVKGGTVERIEFLNGSDVMLLVSKDEKNAGVLIERPNMVEACLYYGKDDLVGISMTGKNQIQLLQGYELRLWHEGAPCDMWFVHGAQKSGTEISPEESKIEA